MIDTVAFAAPPIARVDLDDAFARAVQTAIDAKARPPGSLGRTESIAAAFDAVALVHVPCRRWLRHRFGGRAGHGPGATPQSAEIGCAPGWVAARRAGG